MNTYKQIAEFNNRLSIDPNGTIWDNVRDCEKSTYLAKAGVPSSRKVEAKVRGRKITRTILSLIKQYHPDGQYEQQWMAERNDALEARKEVTRERNRQLRHDLLNDKLRIYSALPELPELPIGEVIKPIAGFEGLYSITDQGRVWTHPRIRPEYAGKQLVGLNYSAGKWRRRCYNNVQDGIDNKTPWARVTLQKDGKHVKKSIARLVWQTFAGPIPEDRIISVHNGDVTDLRMTNLQLGKNMWKNVPVTLVNIHTDEETSYNSIRDAELDIGCYRGGVKAVVRNKQKSTKGWTVKGTPGHRHYITQ